MKLPLFWGLFLIASVANATDPNFAINGLITDETLSRVGHLFYEELVSHWDSTNQSGTITVRERFDPFAGNVIWIEVNDNIVFQDRLGMRASGIEEKAEAASGAVKAYLEQHKDVILKI